MTDTTQMIAGWHAVGAALEAAEPPTELWVDSRRQDRRAEPVLARARRLGITLHSVDKRELERLVPGIRHQGVVARVARVEVADADLLRQPAPRDGLILMLDGVQDPHNLGACLRTAEACGVQAVVIPRDRAVAVNATVRKVAVGSAERVPVIAVANIGQALRDLQQAGYWVTGLAGQADYGLHDLDFTGPTVLVMGAEAEGLRTRTREQCDQLVRIPMRGQVESLNVSVATAVCLYEVDRQRRASGNIA